MALITFLSDFGNSDYYVAAMKAKVYQADPGLNIIDISHNIAHFNIAHASFVLKSVYQSFPEGSVHLVAVSASTDANQRFIGIELNNHFFVGADNGVLSLLDERPPSQIVVLNEPENNHRKFPERDILIQAAIALAQGKKLIDVGQGYEGMKRLLNKQFRATRQKISGSVIHVDHYGNLITNIPQQDFDILSKNKRFRITYGRSTATEIQESIANVVHGETFHIFNSLGLLEIGINMGNGSQLLGLSYDSPIHILFEE